MNQDVVLRLAAWPLCFLIAWLAVCPIAAAQEGAASRIQAVEFRGLNRTNIVYARDIVGVRPGDEASTKALDEAVSRLLRTGKFLSARYDLVTQDDGVHVVFELRERRIVSSVAFEGNAKFADKALAQQVAVKAGDAVDLFAVRGGRDTIRGMYREAGYAEVVVSFDGPRLEQTGELVYRIEEGVRVRVRKIEFEGNTAFPVKQLRKQIATKTALGIFRTGEFDEGRAESDAGVLQRFYRDQGYLDARVSFRRELRTEGRDLELTFTIVEGVQYTVEEIRFRGNAVLAPEELHELMTSRTGTTLRQNLVDSDVRAIQSRYWEIGYIYATVTGNRVFSQRPAFANIIIQIEEGEQFRVGRVVVRGNARTRDKVVRRALNLFPPDDLFDLNEAKEAERRLLETQIFDTARVFPIGDEPGRRDVVIDVQETQRAGDFLFGLGVTSNSGLVGTVVLDLKNFDLFDPPRSFAELRKFRSFFGGGQRLRLELQPGTDVNRFRLDFTEPYLMDKPIRFDASAYLFERGRDGYGERRTGTTFSLGKRFERGSLQGWSGELALRLEGATVDDVNLFSSREIRDDEGAHMITSLKTTLVRDRRDSRLLPSSGDRLRFSYEQFGILGGDYGFGRLTAAYSWYKTMRIDRLERKSVLRLRAEGGVIVGDAPVFERFYAGGTGSIRGFKFRGVGERDGLDDNNIGGDFLVLMGAEYAFPLIGDNIRGHVFLDTGTAGAGAYRASIGVGVRLTIDLFGPLPLEFNLAAPIASDTGDDEQVFSFLIGTLF